MSGKQKTTDTTQRRRYQRHSTNSSNSPVCKLWVTSTGLPPHFQVSWGNIFSLSEAHVRSYLGQVTPHVREVLADVNWRQPHAKVICNRDSCWLCALDSQSPPLKRQHIHLVYQTPLHSQFSIICPLAEPALAPLSRALKEVLNTAGSNIVP